jgi:protease I
MKGKIKVGLMAIVIIASITILAGCVDKEVVTPSTPKSSIIEGGERNILMVIAPKDFRDEELFLPKRIFEEKGAKVTIASTSTEVAEGMLGETVKPDLTISDVNVENYDAFVIVGGTGSKKYLWADEELRAVVKEAYNGDKILAAICFAPVVLANAGILDDKEATVFPDVGAIAELNKAGAIHVDKSVVVSDRIITAKFTDSAEEFALRIMDILVERANKKI